MICLLKAAIECVGNATAWFVDPQAFQHRVLGFANMHYNRYVEIAGQFKLRMEKPHLFVPVQAGYKTIQAYFAKACKLWVAD